jgi:cell wall-associated NlpC family hydrolase
METAALILILAGGLLIRQVVVGRADNIGEDARNAFTSLVNGNFGAISDVSSQRGTNVDPVITDTLGGTAPVTGGTAENGSSKGAALIKEMRNLGGTAKGYRLGSAGPDYYDCSGLVYKAMSNLGYYKGARFSTAMFPFSAARSVIQVTAPSVGDIVLWTAFPTGHMGVVIGQDRMYSALNSREGIRESSISGITGKGKPSYWRIR